MEKVTVIKEALEKLNTFLDIKPEFFIEDLGDSIKVDIDGDNLSFLIGYRGESLHALQTFLGLLVNKDSADWVRVDVDINGYKKERFAKLEDTVRSFIDKVRFFNKEVALFPMNSSERYFVHTFVSDYADVESESVGDKADRHVVLKPASPKL